MMTSKLPDTNTTLPFLRHFSKILAAVTLFLLFVGSLVSTTGSGLAVPDWPLSYGMAFPPMVGGVFYEHGHRLLAGGVGFLTLFLSIILVRQESRKWLKGLGLLAVLGVVLQAILGRFVVLKLLPPPIVIAHAMLGQTFFCLTVVLAYSLSRERDERVLTQDAGQSSFVKWAILLFAVGYVQLFFGALMRHTESGLAIYDFPTMAGRWLPSFSDATIQSLNDWLYAHGLPLVTRTQVLIHFLHRTWAVVVVCLTVLVTALILQAPAVQPRIKRTAKILSGVVVIQFVLGALTIWSVKEPHIASLHLAVGAAFLGTCVILILQCLPVRLSRQFVLRNDTTKIIGAPVEFTNAK